MLDLNHLPPASQLKTTVFYAPKSLTTTNSWQTWTKPRGCSLVNILYVGAGGGGARPTNGNNTGGGGGGAGAVARILIPAQFLPDTLFVRVVLGGAGGANSGNNGANAGVQYVMLQPNTSNASNLIQGGGGGAGTTSAGGNAASAPSIGNQALLGISTTTVGIQGSVGGTAGNVGVSQTFASAAGLVPLTGGAGGGGGNAADLAGGSITVTNSYPFPTLAGVSAGAGPHGHGYNRRLDPSNPQDVALLAFTGGCGGGASNGATGGAGGHGAYGCGGGGGGAGTTSGVGGNGGDGLVIISAW
jgi:hypothetical protein